MALDSLRLMLVFAAFSTALAAQAIPANDGALAKDAWKEELGPEALLRRQTHGGVKVEALGEGLRRVYIFLPSRPDLPKGPVPFVFFHHGWQGMNPKNYGALLDHLAREGNVVLFPVYQDADSTSPQIVTDVTAAAEKAALERLKQIGITPDPARVVYFGYSMGAAISLKLAATASRQHLPAPQALVLVSPGDAYHVAKGDNSRSIWPPLTELRPTLPVAIVTGADDHAIGLPSARKLAAELCRIKPDRRVLLVLPSDTHGAEKVSAGHGSPGAPDSRFDWPLEMPLGDVPAEILGRNSFEPSPSLNQLDFFGYWKVLDAVIDSLAKAPSTSPSYLPPAIVFAHGTPGQLYLGTWPDGTPYPPAHMEEPCAGR